MESNSEWKMLDWNHMYYCVHWHQHNIYINTKAKNIQLVREYQTNLLNSFAARAVAVRTVSEINSGKNSPGVDRKVLLSDNERLEAALNLCLDGTTNYVRRTYVPKPGTEEMRPLGIPTIIDRAKQCLAKLALEPEWEAKFEGNSYGFRPGRSPIDAIHKVRAHLIFNGPCHVLDADIAKCFDRINHEYLINKIDSHPWINQQVGVWLRAGIMDKDELIFPKAGTPQGGVISPMLANIALDGLQNLLAVEIKKKFGWENAKRTYYIRYADDLVILAPSHEVINEAYNICKYFLSTISLEMKAEKTRIIKTLDYKMENNSIVKSTSESFNFLGYRFTQRCVTKHEKCIQAGKPSRIRTLLRIDPSRIERHKASMKSAMKSTSSVKTLIHILNPKIVGWCSYFKHSDVKIYGDLPRKMDIWLNGAIRKWIKRTAKLRGKPNNYWKEDSKDWILYYLEPNGSEVTLNKYSSFVWSSTLYRPTNASYSPYSLTWDEYKDRRN